MAVSETGSATRADIHRLEDKIDNLHSVFITRQEHTATSSMLTALISACTTQLTQLAGQVEKNREATERTNKEGGKWIIEKFEQVEERLTAKLDAAEQQQETRFQQHQTDHSKSSQWLIGLLYGSVSGVVVGIIIVVAQHFFHP